MQLVARLPQPVVHRGGPIQWNAAPGERAAADRVGERSERVLHHRKRPAHVLTEQDLAHGGQREAGHLGVQVDGAERPSPPPVYDLLNLRGHGRRMLVHVFGREQGL